MSKILIVGSDETTDKIVELLKSQGHEVIQTDKDNLEQFGGAVLDGIWFNSGISRQLTGASQG